MWTQMGTLNHRCHMMYRSLKRSCQLYLLHNREDHVATGKSLTKELVSCHTHFVQIKDESNADDMFQGELSPVASLNANLHAFSAW